MPWYTTADARRDAEKQSASKNRENSVRDNEGPSMNDMEREYRQLCRIDETPGVRGLAQLGRNAIERVAQLEKELAAAVAERDRIKGDHDEAAHFARHFIRDDPNITPRGAIIRLGDKCTDLFVRLQQAEARLAAVDSAPVVAVVREMKRDFASGPYKFIYYDSDNLPAGCTELIAKPAKD